MKNSRKRVKSTLLMLLGFLLWMLVGPIVIGWGGETGTFFSFFSWLGLSVTMIGVVAVFYGIDVAII